MITLSREYTLHATHELYAPELSHEENKKLFGKCLNKHGHDYKITVTVSGPPNRHGVVISRQWLDHCVKEYLLEPYEKSHLNDFFPATTGECLAVQFQNLLKKSPLGSVLSKVSVQETPKNWFLTIAQD